MTDRLDDTPPREPAPLPAWMTLPGSLATTSTDEGLDDGPEAPPAIDEAPYVVEEAEVAPSEPEVDDRLQEPSPEPHVADGLQGTSPELDADDRLVSPHLDDRLPEASIEMDDELWDASLVPPGAEVSEPAGLDDVPDEPAENDPQGGGPTLGAALEAILMVVDEPVPEVTLAQVLERPTHEVSTALRALAAEYTQAGRGFDLREVAGGWRFYTRADCAALVERFVRDGQQTRLTQAALETLAVVAYRQPVSRARVAAVRGVNSDGVMRTLVARGLVEEAGTDPESQAVLYRTSSYFLERLGLKDIGELPELAPFLPDDVENLEENTK